MTDDSGTWVYAVTSDATPGIRGVPGIGGTPVRAVAEAGLVAVVSPVDLAEYGEEPLRRNLEDLQWLEATARAHHDVIHAVADAAPVVPMQLATVYRGDERVAAMLAERGDDFRAVLEEIRARSEWGIKVYAAGAAGGSASTGASRSAGSGRPGAAYLQRRRTELSDRERERAEAASSAEDIHDEAAALAVASRLHKPQHPQLTGRSEPMILNAAYLVDDDQAAAFSATADELAGRYPSVKLELTGPWPPYSFTVASQDEDAVANPASFSR